MSAAAYYFGTRTDMMRAICKPGMRIAEIGVFLGDFADVLLGTGPAELVLIDPWADKMVSGDADGNNVVAADLRVVFQMLLGKYKGVPQVQLRRGYSYNELLDFPDGYFDLIYIDGDHSYDGCTKDLELAYKKVKAGGFICGHDYGENLCKAKTIYNFGVKDAVDSFCIRYCQKIIAFGLDGMVSYAIHLDKRG